MSAKDKAKEIFVNVFEYLDDQGLVDLDQARFERLLRKKGVGIDSYNRPDISAQGILENLLNESSYNEKEAVLVALAICGAASDDCFCWPTNKIPATAAAYKAYDGNDCWSQSEFVNIHKMIADGFAEFKKEDKVTTKTTKAKKNDSDEEKPSLKTRAVAATKNAAKKAVVRKVSRRLAKNVGEMAMTQLASNPALVALLSSPVGQAVIPALLAVSLEFMPLPEGVREQIEPFKDALVEELTTQAFDDGTAPLEEMVAFLLPALKDAMVPLLASGGQGIMQLAAQATAPAETIKATVKATA